MKPARYPLVHVVWRDPNAMNLGAWTTRREVRTAKTTLVRSAGWLIRSDDDAIAVATCHLVRGGSNIGGVTLIPKGCIQSIETLVAAR